MNVWEEIAAFDNCVATTDDDVPVCRVDRNNYDPNSMPVEKESHEDGQEWAKALACAPFPATAHIHLGVCVGPSIAIHPNSNLRAAISETTNVSIDRCQYHLRRRNHCRFRQGTFPHPSSLQR
jgi:hypothetical protein